jgi:hypothetical protein
LEEMTYNCLHCGYGGKAKETTIIQIQKENWEKNWKD